MDLHRWVFAVSMKMSVKETRICCIIFFAVFAVSVSLNLGEVSKYKSKAGCEGGVQESSLDLEVFHR